MTALLTLSHGSQHPGAESGVRRLTRSAGGLLGVESMSSHLDFTEPTLTDAACLFADKGLREALVVPLLFTHAFHARHDVPAALEEAQAISGLELHLAPGLGTGKSVETVLARRLAFDAPEGAHVLLYVVGTSCPKATAGIEKLAEGVAFNTGHSVQVVPATGGPGSGGAGVIEAVAGHDDVHLLPLFVADGVLLDRVVSQLTRMQEATGIRITSSPPLTTDLAKIVVDSYQSMLSVNV